MLGADQVTRAWLEAPAADTFVGADGGEAEVGVTALDCADAGPFPALLEACTVNV